MTAPPVLEVADVRRTVDGVEILRGVDWTIEEGQNWVVLGPNGSGKTTLVRIASMWLHPTSGRVAVGGRELGRVDVRALRASIGFASAAMADLLRPDLSVRDAVMTARRAALEPWWHDYDDSDRAATQSALDRVGLTRLAHRPFGALSSGERQRATLARALVVDPELVLLDEPNAGLDLGGREQLVATLAELAADATVAPIALVTHHVEEIPDGFGHALLLREGRVVASGPLDITLTSESLSSCFGCALELERVRGRWTARAR